MPEPTEVRLASDSLKKYQQPEVDAVEEYRREFDHIWEKYPRKVGRKTALDAYIARRREGVPAGKLWDAVCLYAKEREGEEDKYTLLGKTFFGPNERWKEPFERKRENGQTREPMDLQSALGTHENEDPEPDILADL